MFGLCCKYKYVRVKDLGLLRMGGVWCDYVLIRFDNGTKETRLSRMAGRVRQHDAQVSAV